jgi:hypothetical protein
MLRSSDTSESIPLSWWCVAILVTFLFLRLLQNTSNTIVIYTPQMKSHEGPDVDSIHLDIQFRQTDYGSCDGSREGSRARFMKSHSLPTMPTFTSGPKKTM